MLLTRQEKILRAGKIDRSLLQGESFELFAAAIRSPATRDPYERKLLGFLKRVNLIALRNASGGLK